MELLIHIGVDTVQLEGEHFETFITEGQKIKTGNKLASFDIKAIEEAGYSSQVLVINTNTLDYADIILTDEKEVNKDNLLFTAVLTN
jgi:PTS system beta-glucosides-specific IIC component